MEGGGGQKPAQSGEIFELKPCPQLTCIATRKAGGGATALPAPMVVTPQQTVMFFYKQQMSLKCSFF